MTDRLAKGIYWDESLNCFTGCTPVGAGCDNCWAKRMAHRLKGRYGYPAEEPFRPTFHPERLDQLNSKQKPRVIALCFMSDPFHEAHQDKDILRMLFQAANRCPQHIFIALTKRPSRMKEILLYYSNSPIPNLVGGVSIWDQESADKMIPTLLQTNLATRIISLEPCLGPVDFGFPGICPKDWGMGYIDAGSLIDGVILGGESGPGARPMHPDWPRRVRDDCQAANVPFLFKQWGKWCPWIESETFKNHELRTVYPDGSWVRWGLPSAKYVNDDGGAFMARVGKKAAGRLLDGRTWDELPEVMK